MSRRKSEKLTTILVSAKFRKSSDEKVFNDALKSVLTAVAKFTNANLEGNSVTIILDGETLVEKSV